MRKVRCLFPPTSLSQSTDYCVFLLGFPLQRKTHLIYFTGARSGGGGLNRGPFGEDSVCIHGGHDLMEFS